MGGEFQNVTQDIAEALGLARPEGVLVVTLNDMSPLAKAGLKTGDVILGFDGKTVDNAQDAKLANGKVALQHGLGTKDAAGVPNDKGVVKFRKVEIKPL